MTNNYLTDLLAERKKAKKFRFKWSYFKAWFNLFVFDEYPSCHNQPGYGYCNIHKEHIKILPYSRWQRRLYYERWKINEFSK